MMGRRREEATGNESAVRRLNLYTMHIFQSKSKNLCGNMWEVLVIETKLYYVCNALEVDFEII